METDAHRELRAFLSALADIERDVARFERSERPLDETGLVCLRQRLALTKDQLAAKTWTSDKATEAIRALESRLSKLEQE